MWMDPKTFFWRNVYVNIRQWYRPRSTLYIWVSISIDTILNFDGNFDICTNETLSMNRLLDVSIWKLFLPHATKLGQGNVFTGVCDSVHGRGVWGSASVDAGIPPPRSRHPQRADPPWRSVQSMLGDMVNARAVRILLECKLVSLYIPCQFMD